MARRLHRVKQVKVRSEVIEREKQQKDELAQEQAMRERLAEMVPEGVLSDEKQSGAE